MADEKSGIERLRKFAADLSGTAGGMKIRDMFPWCVSNEYRDDTLERFLTDIADEHAAELAAAKRDMTDEAREAVERLRAVDAINIYNSEKIVNAVHRAVTGRDDEDETWRNTFCELRDRLIELIERGGNPDVDVAALRELATYLAVRRAYAQSSPVDANSIGVADGIGDAPERIRKAVDGAHERGNIVARCRPCRTKREAAADWVEKQGGLDAVQKRMVAFAYMLNRVDSLVSGDDQNCFGVHCSLDELSELFGVIMAELDKRLMPQGMEWPRFEKDESGIEHRVEPCDKFASPDGRVVKVEDVTLSCRYGYFRIHGHADDGTGYETKLMFGERVQRPEPEVLGADSRPIRKGEIVYGLSGGEYVVAEVHASKTPQNTDEPWVGYVDGGWDRASSVTHTPPETQERIDDDATRDPTAYCNEVLGWGAEKIVHRSDYAAQNEAMIADLLRRQRELDAKTMGGE